MSYSVLIPRVNGVSLPSDPDSGLIWEERDRILDWIEERGLSTMSGCPPYDYREEESVHVARMDPGFRTAWCVCFKDEAHPGHL